MPGSRRASIVFPVPGGPARRRLWPPAAAISSARRARSCPRTSAMSGCAADAGRIRLAGRTAAALAHRADMRPHRPGDGSARRRCRRARPRAPTRRRREGVRSRSAGALRRSENASDGTDTTVEGKLTDGSVARRVASTGTWREAARIARAIGRSKPGTLLAQAGRSKVDRDPAPDRPFQLGRRDPASHPFLRLLARAVGESDDREPGQPELQVSLHLDAPCVEPDERMRDRPREHASTLARKVQRGSDTFVPKRCPTTRLIRFGPYTRSSRW